MAQREKVASPRQHIHPSLSLNHSFAQPTNVYVALPGRCQASSKHLGNKDLLLAGEDTRDDKLFVFLKWNTGCWNTKRVMVLKCAGEGDCEWGCSTVSVELPESAALNVRVQVSGVFGGRGR